MTNAEARFNKSLRCLLYTSDAADESPGVDDDDVDEVMLNVLRCQMTY